MKLIKFLLSLSIGIWGLQTISYANENTYFNTNIPQNDLEGSLTGSVLFAQHSIFPAKSRIINDIQPHLTARRNTMILFNPIDLNENETIEVFVKYKGGILEKHTMKQPKDLPVIIGSKHGNVDDFNEPSSYDKIVNTQKELQRIENTKDGMYLKSLLETHNSIHILTWNGNWAKNFYLPKADASFEGKTLVFSSHAGYTSNIKINHRNISLSKGKTVILRYINGEWILKSDILLSKISYGKHFWSAIISAEAITQNIELLFKHKNKEGTLKNLNVGAFSEMLLHTIDIGMLTPYRNQFTFQDNKNLHKEYFEMVPLSRLIVSKYAPIYLEEVMLPNGQLLNDFDPSNGGWHTGSMRNHIGKELISLGIDNANYGINASVGESGHPYLSAQITAHNSIGNYINGRQRHGGSGGGGMITLDHSIGNEFSHEIGHNYGLSHYPNNFNGTVHAPANKINSTWGWNSQKNMFIPNFRRSVTHKQSCYKGDCQDPFEGYAFGYASLGGGSPMHNTSFTLYTPYETAMIQKFFEHKVNFDQNSSTGFSKWNPEKHTMQSWEYRLNNQIKKPYKQGVPVTTLVGYYDPEQNLTSYIYPALHGSYGMVYEDQASVDINSCYLKVQTEEGRELKYALHNSRKVSTVMNAFHVNIEEALHATQAEVSCSNQTLALRNFEHFNGELNTSIISHIKNISKNELLSPKLIFAKKIGNNSIRIKFHDKSKDEEGFKIYREDNTLLKVIPSKENKGLLKTKIYDINIQQEDKIYIVAYKGEKESKHSNTIKIKPLLLSPKLIFAKKIGNNTIRIKFHDKSKNEEGFKIYREDNTLLKVIPLKKNKGLVKRKIYDINIHKEDKIYIVAYKSEEESKHSKTIRIK